MDDELIYNGRECNHCHLPIARPANMSQAGLPNAVVCDACWIDAGKAFQDGLVSLSDIGRELGVNLTTVRRHMASMGLLPGSDEGFKEQGRRDAARRREEHKEEVYEARRAWGQTERGRQYMREYMREKRNGVRK